MKKILLSMIAVMAMFTSAMAQDATVDDLKVCDHGMVINFSDITNAGEAKPGKRTLCNDYVLDVTGGSVATNKGQSDPSSYVSADGSIDLTTMYSEYKEIKNTFRLKNGQDVIAMNVTAGTKLRILGQVHASRYPKITDEAPSGNQMQGTVYPLAVNTVSTDGYSEWVAPKDMVIYIGSEAGDWYLGYIIVELYKEQLISKIIDAKKLGKDELTSAIAAAEGILDTPSATEADFKDALETLEAAIGDPTAINTVSVSAAKVAKAMVNGKVVIVKGAKQYNVAGQEL